MTRDAMRLSPPSSKKFDSLPTGPASSSSHTDATARSASVAGSTGGCGRGRFGAMPAKAFRSTFRFALKGHSSRTVTSWGDEVGGKEPGHAGQHPGRIHVSPLVGDHERMHHRAPVHPASGHGGLPPAPPWAAYLHLRPDRPRRPMSPVRYQRPPSSTKEAAVFPGSPRYPSARLPPPIHSSPGTQSGQSRPSSPTTRKDWLERGLP